MAEETTATCAHGVATVRPKKAASTVASTAGKPKNRMSWRLGVAASTRLVARKPGF